MEAKSSSKFKNVVSQFLTKHSDPDRPLLLALSGGPDSMALLFVLEELKLEFPIKYSIAHVDHRWRDASSEEAQQLGNLAKKLNVPFYLKVLDPSDFIGNIEAACRDARLNFFDNLCQNHNFQAVLLGHHADDQAENILKKLFEGAGLSSLGALHEVQSIGNLILWRPLLAVRKLDILNFINGRVVFDDPTNRDDQFLRAKFRMRIIPWLSSEFGKQISPTLNRLGREANELNAYLDERIAIYLSKVISGPFGSLIDLSGDLDIPTVELKHLIRRLAEYNELELSVQEIDAASEMIKLGKANKELRFNRSHFQIDRGRFFVLRRPLDQLNEIIWAMNVTTITEKPQAIEGFNDWVSVWKGEVHVLLPFGEYNLKVAEPKESYLGSSSLSKWWGNAKVPAFFRNVIPVLWQDKTVVHEFLTGRRKLGKNKAEAALHINVKLQLKPKIDV